MENLMINIPVTEAVAEYKNWHFDDGYAQVPVMVCGGKFIQMFIRTVIDLDKEYLLILSNKSQELKIVNHAQQHLAKAKTLEELMDTVNYYSNNLGGLAGENLKERDIFVFDFKPLDTFSMTPNTWLQAELKRARSLGVVFKINEKTIPENILLGMINQKELAYLQELGEL